MQESKLIGLWLSLGKRAIKQFGLYVHAPYFNVPEQSIALYDLLAGKSSKQIEGLSKEAAYKALFPKKPYSDPYMRHAMSYLMKALEDHLILEHRTDERLHRDLDLLRIYRGLELDKHYSRQYKQALSHMEKDPCGHIENLHLDYLIDLDHYNFDVWQRGRKPDIKIDAASAKLDLYYAANKLKHACTVLSFRGIFKAEDHFLFMQEILEMVEREELKDHPYVRLYHQAYLSFSDPDDPSHFERLLKTTDELAEQIGKEELKSSYMLMINYCIRKGNGGEREYFKILFDIYKRCLRDEVLLEHKKLSPYTYRNISSLGFLLGELDWTEAFIEEYGKRLSGEHPDSAYQFNLARLMFERGKFEKCVDILSASKMPDLLSEIVAKVWTIKAFYELEEHQLLDSMIGSFKQLLKRKQVLSYHKNSYMNFTRIMNRLIWYNPYKKGALEKLVVEVESLSELTEKPWIQKKLAELKA